MALVGANGAGKSTLIKILTGYYETYEGQVEIDGRVVHIHEPTDAARAGIQAVYQEVDTVLVPTLTVSENVLLNQLRSRRGTVLNWAALHKEAEAVLERVGLTLDVRRRVEDLVLHEKQMLVIARAVSQQVKYLIFDEPTTSLSLPEVEQLFTIIRTLKAQGVGILYISHRLMEVTALADDITVLRNGRKITQFPADEFDFGRVSEAMLGTAIQDIYPPKAANAPGDVVLEARDLTRRGKLDGVSLSARQGEILGVAGLVGAGKTELLRALFGADALDGGRVQIDGRQVALKTPQQAVNHGVYLVPEERRAQGVLVEEKVGQNISLPFLSQFSRALGLIDRLRERTHAAHTIERLGILPPNPEVEVKNLSGGNQQKVVIGKWLTGQPRVVMFDEATQGIDVKAKQDVYRIARDLTQSAAVIYASSDIDEVIGIADRLIVMHDGQVVAEFTTDAFDRNLILEYATGAREKETHDRG
ncbi:MAG: sugar ABC transporter ATP-binding protein [Anaerolineae bacterium]|nr:sugar ABC transporter ATP-binding protein [Anaerolineae bacterium]